MQMMAVDPFERACWRHASWPACLAMPLLTGYFHRYRRSLGGYFVAVKQLGVDGGAFWAQMQASVGLVDDVINGVVIKSIAFGWLANWIAVFEGYDAMPTSEGVSLATTRTVVNTSLGGAGIGFRVDRD
jgi:phospholipid/cholesterol/gamma-HCH transport system permease protein